MIAEVEGTRDISENRWKKGRGKEGTERSKHVKCSMEIRGYV